VLFFEDASLGERTPHVFFKPSGRGQTVFYHRLPFAFTGFGRPFDVFWILAVPPLDEVDLAPLDNEEHAESIPPLFFVGDEVLVVRRANFANEICFL